MPGRRGGEGVGSPDETGIVSSSSLLELEDCAAGGCGVEDEGRAPFPMVRTIVARLGGKWQQI